MSADQGDDPVEFVETVELVEVDLHVEAVPEGIVLSFEVDAVTPDFAVLLTRQKARDLGERLFKAGSTALPPR